MKRSMRLFALLMGMLLISSAGPTMASATPLSWTVSHVDGNGTLRGISCPTESLCVAGDSAGNIVTSTNPTGGAGTWSVAHVAQHDITAVSCPSTSLCVAGNEAGELITSTNPTGGAGAWTATDMGEVGLYAVSCPSTSLCVAVGNGSCPVGFPSCVEGDQDGDVLTSTNPAGGAGTWSRANVENIISILGVSCPAVSLCVAGDQEGNVLTSANPTGGAGAWTVTKVAQYIDAVACPSVSLCVVGNSDGDLMTSINPTGGAGAWTVVKVGSASHFSSISCPSVSMCVAVNYGGDVFTSTNPTGGAGAWTSTNVTGGAELRAVSCPSTSLCVAGGTGGNVAIGTPAVLPINTSLPTISGTAQVGQTLSCAPGSWSGSVPQTYAYQWQRDGTAIGIVTASYLISAADQGHTLTCVVTASNPAGPGNPAASAPTGVVQAAPAPPAPPPPAAAAVAKPAAAAKCVVPKLKGKTLTQAKGLLTRAHCKLGKVSSSKTPSNHKAVVSQKPGPGKKLAAGTKIAISLG